MKALFFGTFSYFLVFAFTGAIIASIDYAETRALFVVVGQPVEPFWIRVWSYFPESLGEGIATSALISPFYFFLCCFFRARGGFSMPRFLTACGLAGLISASIVINYLIAIGRAIWPPPWYERPLFASLPSALFFIFLITLATAFAASRMGRKASRNACK